jgi:hypothetical protein
MAGPQAVLFWGFQGTLDHRASLTAGQFRLLDIEPPEEDVERFVSKAELNATLEHLERLGVPHSTAPGGSPLISALTADAWFRANAPHAASRFVGVRPDGLSGYVDAEARDTLSLAEANPVIGGTLALEYRPTNSKLMLSVPDGRWLDEALAQRSLDAIAGGVLSLRPKRIGVGIGGLNKASLPAVQRMIEEIRQLPLPVVIFATGSSFRMDIGTQRPPDFWDRLLAVLSAVDVVSLSSAEHRQLNSIWGEAWVERALRSGSLKFLISHSSKDALVLRGGGADVHLSDVVPILEAARAEATHYAEQALTGLGARFDGVLTAALLLSWSEGGLSSNA